MTSKVYRSPDREGRVPVQETLFTVNAVGHGLELRIDRRPFARSLDQSGTGWVRRLLNNNVETDK
jgi:hypothetical protein